VRVADGKSILDVKVSNGVVLLSGYQDVHHCDSCRCDKKIIVVRHEGWQFVEWLIVGRYVVVQ
jgi:hypothetical protein